MYKNKLSENFSTDIINLKRFISGVKFVILFDNLPLDKSILEALCKLRINYVFQPIFKNDGKEIYAYEALMRPENCTVTELIQEYIKRDELHVLEVATYWGATQEYFMRGYKEKLSINSFPCECFSEEETIAYADYFGHDKNLLIIEMLEYPKFSIGKSIAKKEVAAYGDSQIAIDDFGVGFNDMNKVEFMDPAIVKIDRSLLSGIDKDENKQKNCRETIDKLHTLGKLVVAEGIETKEEFEYLKNLGADLFQGFYLGRPA